MNESVHAFYDDLAGHYHLLFADWSASITYQAEVLDRLIRDELGVGPRTVLDAACGIGTQAIGLALRGHQVRATDLSPHSIARLSREMAVYGVTIDASVADLRFLANQVSGTFDVVLACDNALPHLLVDPDLDGALSGMAAKLRPGGLLLVSTRDYDELRRTRPHTHEPHVFDGPDGRRIAFQVWDWEDDGMFYRVHQFILQQQGAVWQAYHIETSYRALGQTETLAAVERAGLTSARWIEPAASGYYQPILVARKKEERGPGTAQSVA